MNRRQFFKLINDILLVIVLSKLPHVSGPKNSDRCTYTIDPTGSSFETINITSSIRLFEYNPPITVKMAVTKSLFEDRDFDIENILISTARDFARLNPPMV